MWQRELAPAWASGCAVTVEVEGGGRVSLARAGLPRDGALAILTVLGRSVVLTLAPPAAPAGAAAELIGSFLRAALGGRAVDIVVCADRLLRGLYGDDVALEITAFEPGSPGGGGELFVHVAAYPGGVGGWESR